MAVPADAATPIVLRAKSLEKTGDDKRWSAKRKTVHAVQGVSLEIRREQTIGIDGESGSGKSTVARCIVRLVDANGGSVRLGSEDITMMSHGVLHALRKRVQIVFQDSYHSLNLHRTVAEAMTQGLVNYGPARTEALQRARRLLAMVRMDVGTMERYAPQFSGGQRQRICMARPLFAAAPGRDFALGA